MEWPVPALLWAFPVPGRPVPVTAGLAGGGVGMSRTGYPPPHAFLPQVSQIYTLPRLRMRQLPFPPSYIHAHISPPQASS